LRHGPGGRPGPGRRRDRSVGDRGRDPLPRRRPARGRRADARPGRGPDDHRPVGQPGPRALRAKRHEAPNAGRRGDVMAPTHGLLRHGLPVLLGLLVTAGPAAAQAVKVSVVAILASENSDYVDPRLACIAREVQKMDPKLTGFRFATM